MATNKTKKNNPTDKSTIVPTKAMAQTITATAKKTPATVNKGPATLADESITKNAQKSTLTINTTAKDEMKNIPTTSRKTIKAKTTATLMVKGPTPSYEEIAQRAYSLFQKRGYQHGNDIEDWCQAERDLLTIK